RCVPRLIGVHRKDEVEVIRVVRKFLFDLLLVRLPVEVRLAGRERIILPLDRRRTPPAVAALPRFVGGAAVTVVSALQGLVAVLPPVAAGCAVGPRNE